MNKVDKTFITILLLFQVNFFDIFPLGEFITNSVSGYSQKKLMLVIVIIYCIVSKLLTINIQSTRPSFFGLSILLLLSMVTFITFLSAKAYDQSISSTFYIGYYFFIILLYFPIKKSIKTSKDMYWLISIISKMGFWTALIKIVQSGLKSFWNINVFSLNTSFDVTSYDSMRFTFLHFVRLASASDFVEFSLVLLIIGSVIFNGHRTNFNFWIIFIVDVFYIIVVGQTRMYIMITMVVVAVWILITLRSSDRISNFILYTMVITIGGLFAILLIDGFDLTNGDRSISLSIRQDAINYFINNINYNGLYGFGFARDDLYGYLVHGSTSLWWGGVIQSGYNYDDVGIFGFLAIFGYSAIPFLLVFLIQSLDSIFKSKYKPLSLLIVLVMAMGMVSTSLFNPQRIIYLSFYLAILCWLAKVKGDKNETCH